MMKKGGWILASIIVAILGISFLVSAQPAPGSLTGLFSDTWNGVTDVLKIVFEPILGSTNDGQIARDLKLDKSDDVLFMKVLFFLLVMFASVLGLGAIDFFNDKGWVKWISGAIVSILAVRFILTSAWIETILLPYSFWGIFVVALSRGARSCFAGN